MKGALLISIMMLLISIPLLSGCCGGDDEEEEEPPPTVVVEFDVVEGAVATHLASDSAGSGANIKADALNGLINDGDDSTTPYIISVRSATDYAAGHIPGAVNIALGDLFTAETLATLDAVPSSPTPDIVVYCYTGQTASMAQAILSTLGYDVKNLLHGMCSWSDDDTITAGKCFAESKCDGLATETTANTATETYDDPTLDNTTSADDAEIVKAAAQTYTTGKYITASDLNGLINDGDDSTTPFIISARSADDYAAGHIPGAVNIGIGSLADNLDKLPTDKDIVVYCYTGHTAAQVVGLLNILGYDASSLKYGMCSWSDDDTVTAGKCFGAAACFGYDTEAS